MTHKANVVPARFQRQSAFVQTVERKTAFCGRNSRRGSTKPHFRAGGGGKLPTLGEVGGGGHKKSLSARRGDKLPTLGGTYESLYADQPPFILWCAFDLEHNQLIGVENPNCSYL